LRELIWILKHENYSVEISQFVRNDNCLLYEKCGEDWRGEAAPILAVDK